MKKIKVVLLIIIILIGGHYYSKKNNKYSSKDVYILGNKTYSIFTNKEISGYVIKEGFSEIIYSQYKNGVLSSEKRIDQNSNLISKKSFNKQGLLEGESYGSFDNEKSRLNYKNSILNGKSETENTTIDFIDGTINGKNILSQYSFFESNELINYKNGVPDFIPLDIPTPNYPKKILVDVVTVPEGFTGGIINLSPSHMVLAEYENGELKRERFYSNYSMYRREIPGLKFRDIIYFKDKQVSKLFEYEGGLLKNLITFNINNQKDGIAFERKPYSNQFTIKNYENGIPNGKYEKYYLTKNDKVEKLLGVYKLGILSGQDLDCNEVENFLNGFRVENLDLKEVINDKKNVVEKFKDIPENFTGFNSDGSTINEYKNGKHIKEYIYTPYSDITVKEFKDDGGYYFNVYNSGRIQSEREADKHNVNNGKYVEHFYEGKSCTKTTGTLVNNEMAGESIHYHGDKIVHIDIYHPNETYTRTYYKDYKNNEIEKVVIGKKVEGMWVEES